MYFRNINLNNTNKIYNKVINDNKPEVKEIAFIKLGKLAFNFK